MSAYQVLARKWRPQNFEELVGQEKVLAALVHGLTENRLHHAYLFTGTRGVGKTTVARILAKCLNCEKGISAKPCDECETCLEIRGGRFIDLIEIDAASRTKVEDTRDLLDNVLYAPAKGRFKIYLIDEVHMLSTHSFNALLKTLEEPPEHVKFLLATTDPHKLPITVLSRCLQFHLKPISVERIVERLQLILGKEQIDADTPALFALAKAAEGSLRDALSLTDQAIGQGGGAVKTAPTLHMLGVTETPFLYALANAVAEQNQALLFDLLGKLAEEPLDYNALLKLFAEMWYEVSLKQVLAAYQSIEWDNAILEQLAQTLSPTLTQLFYDMAVQGKKELPFSPEPRIGFNMTLLRMLAFQPLPLEQKQLEKPSSISERELHLPQGAAIVEPHQKKVPLEAWDTLLNTLPMSGVLKQLLKNTHFERCEGNTLFLSIPAQHQILFNEGVKNKFLHLLQTYYERSFLLQIQTNKGELEGPAAKAEQSKKTQETQLQEKLELDPNINFIKNNLNGTITSVALT